MSAPLVFKGREHAMTQNELAASSAATKANGPEDENEEERILKIESDLVEPPGGSEKMVGRKRQPSQPATNKAAKKRKQAEVQEALKEPSQTALTSLENQSSSQYVTPGSTSPIGRNTTKSGNSTGVAPAAQMLPLGTSIPNGESGPEDHGTSDTERDDVFPKPAQVPRRRGRPRKTHDTVSTNAKPPVPAGSTTKGKSRPTGPCLRRSTRGAATEKAIPAKKVLATALSFR
ncbi:chromo domain-containing protein [Colletotrichum orchidophilum]|uniref:Chromo domain-containing protein n=1 Tax=Colletotrichum orchidophilum TaxID=1209926 RepID=A0A1G4B5I9_9PEZI|nr:chromo domain-containing protein [Colletotrichum orchidophilum]OHE96710.1 chromo domain-containing protein [Colletotrichum orchidophilum]